ncbi:MAG: hypothetical protein KKD44_28475 [Proteobacteria bacterium]|nr:hypothetical protein [Pseudomonadota bacterium]
MNIFSTLTEVPLWYLVLSPLVGAIVGMSLLLVSLVVLGKPKQQKVAPVTLKLEPELKSKIESEPRAKAERLGRAKIDELEIEVEVEPEVKMEVISPQPMAVRAEPVVVPFARVPAKQKPVPPIRQHYWYYVSGVTERFATLREALSASGETVPADKALDWKKLSSDTRAKIKRVKVGDEQPVLEQVVVRKVVREEEVRDEPKREEKVAREEEVREEIRKESDVVIKKPIGNGAFVTITKKKSK